MTLHEAILAASFMDWASKQDEKGVTLTCRENDFVLEVRDESTSRYVAPGYSGSSPLECVAQLLIEEGVITEDKIHGVP